MREKSSRSERWSICNQTACLGQVTNVSLSLEQSKKDDEERRRREEQQDWKSSIDAKLAKTQNHR